MSANCPIEVIYHQRLQIKSRPCCHLHQATKHALFQRPPLLVPARYPFLLLLTLFQSLSVSSNTAKLSFGFKSTRVDEFSLQQI
jgi:hypothetical protein